MATIYESYHSMTFAIKIWQSFMSVLNFIFLAECLDKIDRCVNCKPLKAINQFLQKCNSITFQKKKQTLHFPAEHDHLTKSKIWHLTRIFTVYDQCVVKTIFKNAFMLEVDMRVFNFRLRDFYFRAIYTALLTSRH